MLRLREGGEGGGGGKGRPWCRILARCEKNTSKITSIPSLARVLCSCKCYLLTFIPGLTFLFPGTIFSLFFLKQILPPSVVPFSRPPPPPPSDCLALLKGKEEGVGHFAEGEGDRTNDVEREEAPLSSTAAEECMCRRR